MGRVSASSATDGADGSPSHMAVTLAAATALEVCHRLVALAATIAGGTQVYHDQPCHTSLSTKLWLYY